MEKLASQSSLDPELILNAYRNGLFPMAEGKTGEVEFFYYEPRGIIPLDERFRVRRSLKKIIDKKQFTIKFDTAFEEVIRACSRHDRLPEEGIWLSEEMIRIYCELHRNGYAHSVEVWEKQELIGGLYGIVVGSAFCGESMFSRKEFASQVALVFLVEHLRTQGFTLLDAQMESEHLRQFGMYSVTQTEYLQLLGEALQKNIFWS
ncbi:MAG: leucyl/phenylalanyl-tRNA--protein transferase [Ignavibacteriota bacterium]